jgi:hypothetical protein
MLIPSVIADRTAKAEILHALCKSLVFVIQGTTNKLTD